jgi:hypothetical protein
MGFNKRVVNEDIINRHIQKENSLNNLFKADALIFKDDVSLKIYDWFIEGIDIGEIKKNIIKYHESRTI